MSDASSPTVFDWLFRILAAAGPIGSAVFAYIWRVNAKRNDDFDERLTATEGLSQQNRIDNLKMESAMGQLQIRITENVSKSIERVHDKIEQGNRESQKKFDQLNENFEEKIVELRRDLKGDIRDALNSNGFRKSQ